MVRSTKTSYRWFCCRNGSYEELCEEVLRLAARGLYQLSTPLEMVGIGLRSPALWPPSIWASLYNLCRMGPRCGEEILEFAGPVYPLCEYPG